MASAISLNTPIWFAASEIQFQDLVGPASDIWALACVMYQILHGGMLFPSYDQGRNMVLMEMVFTCGKFPDQVVEQVR